MSVLKYKGIILKELEHELNIESLPKGKPLEMAFERAFSLKCQIFTRREASEVYLKWQEEAVANWCFFLG